MGRDGEKFSHCFLSLALTSFLLSAQCGCFTEDEEVERTFLLSPQCGCFTEDEEVERKGPCRVLCLN